MKKIIVVLILTVGLFLNSKVEAQLAQPAAVVKKADAGKVKAVVKADAGVVKADASLLAAPAILPAIEQPAQINEWWKVLVNHLLELIFGILGIVATGTAAALMKKFGFETYSAKIEEIISSAIGLAEQKSAQKLKVAGTPMGNAEKLEIAMKFAEAKAKEYKIPEKGKDWWETKIESWLGIQKIG
jgi:hypothetical protein